MLQSGHVSPHNDVPAKAGYMRKWFCADASARETLMALLHVVALRTFSDFHGYAALTVLFELPLDTPEARAEWGSMVGDLLAIASRSDDAFAQAQLKKLIATGEQYPSERLLQESAARAEYNLGNIYLFGEGDLPNAATQYTSAIARVGQESLTGKMAAHNFGILTLMADGDRRSAFRAFTAMIESTDASDEMRACALNNRADLFAEDGDNDKAIRDRTEVLTLADTSADRRFIALFRRSQSYLATGKPQAAIDDLGQILKSWDMWPEQKAESRLGRAFILRNSNLLDKARVDLEAVIGSHRLRHGMRAAALVELAEVHRRTSEFEQAGDCLARVAEDDDASVETRVNAMIVGARTFEDTGDKESARELWQSIVDSPIANEYQKQTARAQLDAPSK